LASPEDLPKGLPQLWGEDENSPRGILSFRAGKQERAANWSDPKKEIISSSVRIWERKKIAFGHEGKKPLPGKDRRRKKDKQKKNRDFEKKHTFLAKERGLKDEKNARN